MEQDRSKRRVEDPYEADSDKEYEPLEADRLEEEEAGISPDTAIRAAETETGAGQAFPSPDETAARSRELREMLRESVNRDPEVLAADQSRLHSDDLLSGINAAGRRLLERTTEFEADDFDDEDLMDQGIER